MLVVLLGALLHACWNALVKAGSDKFLDAALISAGGGALALVVLPLTGLPAAPSWPFLLVSAVIHIGYFSLVAAAYRIGELSYSYPLMRGTAPLIVAVASGVIFSEGLTVSAWLGILLISAGLIAMTLGHWRRGAMLAPTLFALANAVVIAVYTGIDGLGARRSNAPVAYVLAETLLTGLALLAILGVLRRGRLASRLAARWHMGALGGTLSVASYALALWAMTRAPIAPVAALRETAIVFGTLIGALVLKERFGSARYLAVATVAAGAMALRLG